MSARMETSENLCQVVGGVNGHLKNLVNGVVSETIIVQSSQENVCFSGENADLRFQNNGFGSCKHQEVDYGGGIGGVNSQFKECYDGESLCRICHLNSEQSLHITSTTAAAMELIQIGCGCKDELGIAHSHCAEAWFKLKGN
ncbi:hypothetical protein Gogos_013009, partial [Gossypium gossypioides]|nr:hypothetical protein [Gossypium gossypioides]